VRAWVIVVAAAAALALPGVAAPDLNRGPQSILAILATWGPQPFTPDDLKTSIFRDADQYVRDVSFGQASLTGDVTPWLPIKEFTNCDPVDQSDLALAALDAAKKAGYDPTKYSRYVFAFPRPAPCGYLGVGAANEVWLFGTSESRVLKHELGHTFSLGHAWSMSCATCRPVEYGDPYDVMGHGVGHYNAFEKFSAGWLTGIATADRNGTYTIDQLEQQSAQPQLLVVHTAVNDYWFDHREPLLEDAAYAGQPIVQGVEVHASPSPDDREGRSPYQPGDVMVLDPTGHGDAILPGDTWGEAGAFSLTVLDHVGTHVDVRFTWTDTTPPGRVAIYSPLKTLLTRKLDVEWGRATESGSGIEDYEVRVDGKLRATVAGDAPRQALLPRPRRGRHAVSVVAVDRAGNRSRAATSVFRVR
jgi:gametolysin peptidase M11